MGLVQWGACEVTKPMQAEVWAELVLAHPDREFAHFIVRAFGNGSGSDLTEAIVTDSLALTQTCSQSTINK